MASILNLIVGNSVGCPLNCPLFPYLKVVGYPLSCPLSCPLYPYMAVVDSLICIAKFPWAAHGQPTPLPTELPTFSYLGVVGCPLSCPLFSYLEVVGCPLSCPLFPYMEVVNTWQFNSAKTIFAFSCPPQTRRRVKLFASCCRPCLVHQYTILPFSNLHLPGEKFTCKGVKS